MKIKYIISLIVTSTIVVSCGSYGYVYLDYPQSPQVSLPHEIDEIAIVNRSLIKEENRQNRVFESVITGEVAGSDKIASDEAIKGVLAGMQNQNYIKMILPDTLRIYGTGTRQLPDVLSWDLVSGICADNQADALLVLETFDSNSNIVIQTAVQQVSSVLKSGKPSPQLPRQAQVDVRSYWRLYDPYTKTIIDQFQQTHLLNFSLINGVPPLNALPETAYAAGYDYASRFLPGYYRVKRDLYKKGKGKDKNEFATGWRRSEVANWKDAIEIWTRIASNVNSVSAGRAALNVAVAYEVLGNTELALEWAQRAYENHGDKQARDYAKILLRRKRFEL